MVEGGRLEIVLAVLSCHVGSNPTLSAIKNESWVGIRCRSNFFISFVILYYLLFCSSSFSLSAGKLPFCRVLERTAKFQRQFKADVVHGFDGLIQRDYIIVPRQRHVALDMAFDPPIIFLPRQGTSTRLATGSHARPVTFWRAIDAAFIHSSTVPPSIWATPSSHGRSAPHLDLTAGYLRGKVADSAMNIPIDPAASIPLVISSLDAPIDRPTPISVPGRHPHEPAVGAPR